MNRKILMKFTLCLLVLLIAFNGSNITAFADKEDFYKEFEDEIKDAGLSDSSQDLIKAYDYDTNSFDCGFTDIVCKIKGIYYQSILGLVKMVYQGLKSAIFTPDEITGNKIFKDYKTSFSVVANTMLAIFVMWHMMKMVAQRYADAEDGMIALNGKILMFVTSAILLGFYDEFFEWILQFQSILVNEVIYKSVSIKQICLVIFINGVKYGEVLVLIIAFTLFIFQIIFMYRFILFGFLYITGVLAIPTSLNDEYNYFSLWLRLIINNGVTLFLQVLAFAIGMRYLIKVNGDDMGNVVLNNATSWGTAIAFFVLAITIPGLLGQLGASSGTARSVGAAAKHFIKK